jgi:GTP-binding protein
MIIDEIPPPASTPGAPFQMLVSDLSYSDYLGRLAIGKIVNGSVSSRENLVCIPKPTARRCPSRFPKFRHTGGMVWSRPRTAAGDIIILAGIADVHIGDTICTGDQAVALPRLWWMSPRYT